MTTGSGGDAKRENSRSGAACKLCKRSIITTNLEFARWNDIFADTKITAALLDRLIHHSHMLDFTNRDSGRLMEALIDRVTKNYGK